MLALFLVLASAMSAQALQTSRTELRIGLISLQKVAAAAQRGQSQISADELDRRIKAAAINYGQAHGYNVILNVDGSSSTVMWALPATDISQAIVDAYRGAANPSLPNAISARIAVLNFEQIVFASDQGQQAVKRVQEEFTPWKQQIEADSKTVEELREEVKKLPSSDPKQAALQHQIDEKAAALSTQAQKASDAYTDRLQKAFGAVARLMTVTMNDYVSQHGYTLLIDKEVKPESILWSATGTELATMRAAKVAIDQEVVAAYNAIPAKPAIVIDPAPPLQASQPPPATKSEPPPAVRATSVAAPSHPDSSPTAKSKVETAVKIAPPAPAPPSKSRILSRQDVLSLLKDLEARRVATLVSTRGVSFALDPGAEKELRAAGADDGLLLAIATHKK